MKDPGRYLAELGITLPGAVDPDREARLDPGHRVLLNHEAYFFASKANRDRFLASPYEFTGLVTDPVTRNRFQPTATSPRRELRGRLYLFSDLETAARFDAAPESFATPMIEMQEAE